MSMFVKLMFIMVIIYVRVYSEKLYFYIICAQDYNFNVYLLTWFYNNFRITHISYEIASIAIESYYSTSVCHLFNRTRSSVRKHSTNRATVKYELNFAMAIKYQNRYTIAVVFIISLCLMFCII